MIAFVVFQFGLNVETLIHQLLSYIQIKPAFFERNIDIKIFKYCKITVIHFEYVKNSFYEFIVFFFSKRDSISDFIMSITS